MSGLCSGSYRASSHHSRSPTPSARRFVRSLSLSLSFLLCPCPLAHARTHAGLDQAGKTQTLYWLKYKEKMITMPTVGEWLHCLRTNTQTHTYAETHTHTHTHSNVCSHNMQMVLMPVRERVLTAWMSGEVAEMWSGCMNKAHPAS